jgi:hypothetical protein
MLMVLPLDVTTGSGYLHPDYAASLAEFGRPRHLPAAGGFILERPIAGSDRCDAMGSYPLFSCHDWSRLALDLADLCEELIALTLVADPFGPYTPTDLRRCFGDVMIPFKEHFVADLRGRDPRVSRHHRYYARRSLAKVRVERCDEPPHHLQEWTALYGTLVERHGLRGIRAFSPAAFARQLTIPGLVMFRATFEGSAVGAHLWYVQGDVAYSHLAASSPRGYDLMTSYALYSAALEHFTGVVSWIDWGAGAGGGVRTDGGLHRFKQGWSTGTRTAYLCGRIFDPQRYARICEATGTPPGRYFPAYREGEF